MYGTAIHHAFNFFSCGWEVDNDCNYLESKVEWKILTCDPSDDVIDIYSSLYTGVCLRYIESEQGFTKKIDLNKYPKFYPEDLEFFNSMKDFFDIFTLVADSIKEKDVLMVESKTNYVGASNYLEEIKREPVSANRVQIEKSRAAREFTKNLTGTRYMDSRQKLMETYNFKEEEFIGSITALFTNYIKPFRNVFSALNGGISTLYEVLHNDRKAIMEDLRLFVVFLEVYGTGRAVKPTGEYVSITERRKNSLKKIDSIISDLLEISKTNIEPNKVPGLFTHISSLAEIIIKGFKGLKSYLDEKLKEDKLEESFKDQEPNYRLNYDSDDNRGDIEKSLNEHEITKQNIDKKLGYIIPMKWGHRGYPKDKEKEKKALDLLLFRYKFTSKGTWDQEEESEEDDGQNQ